MVKTCMNGLEKEIVSPVVIDHDAKKSGFHIKATNLISFRIWLFHIDKNYSCRMVISCG